VEAARQLEDIGIIARPLSHYYLPGTPKSKKTNGLVFGFACSTPKQIVSAVKKMASL
jgi:DNA-binding transcriptional MocR family regulator